MVISRTDRVSTVLARDERLVDVFTSLASTFEKLRSPTMRKVMARLVTVEQAARVAGIDPDLLVDELNAALGTGTGPGEQAMGVGKSELTTSGAAESSGAPTMTGTEPSPGASGAPHNPEVIREMTATTEPTDLPAVLAEVPPESIVDIDVRPDLRRGEEPFSKIMAARREVPEGGVLRLRATFEPVPLYAVLGKQGMKYWTERFADDDWRVWFYTAGPESEAAAGSGTLPAGAGAAAGDAAPAVAEGDPEDDLVILDVRGLEPPEPMMRTFAALEALPPGKTLLQINVRVPQFLLPQLAERGFTYEIREQSKDLARIFIRHSKGE